MGDDSEDVFNGHFRWGLGRVYLTKKSFIADWESSILDTNDLKVMHT